MPEEPSPEIAELRQKAEAVAQAVLDTLADQRTLNNPPVWITALGLVLGTLATDCKDAPKAVGRVVDVAGMVLAALKAEKEDNE
jgi:hypothetical protein